MSDSKLPMPFKMQKAYWSFYQHIITFTIPAMFVLLCLKKEKLNRKFIIN